MSHTVRWSSTLTLYALQQWWVTCWICEVPEKPLVLHDFSALIKACWAAMRLTLKKKNHTHRDNSLMMQKGRINRYTVRLQLTEERDHAKPTRTRSHYWWWPVLPFSWQLHSSKQFPPLSLNCSLHFIPLSLPACSAFTLLTRWNKANWKNGEGLINKEITNLQSLFVIIIVHVPKFVLELIIHNLQVNVKVSLQMCLLATSAGTWEQYVLLTAS